MTEETYKKPTLIGIAGPRKGKKYRLKTQAVSLGSAEDSDIVVEGEKVSEIHTELRKKAAGNYEVRNKSHWGTLVNQARVDVAELYPGDQVQIGEQSLFKFDAKEVSAESVGDSDGFVGLLLAKPLVSVGLGAYLVIMALVVILLTSPDGGGADTGLTAEFIEEALVKTEVFLTEEAGKGIAAGALTADALPERTHDEGSYYFIALSSDNPADTDAAIAALVEELNEKFFIAWGLEKRNRNLAAIKVYREILATVPDARAPTTKIASWRMNSLKNRVVND